jgi:hypothetical protein
MAERRVIRRAADEALMTPRPQPDGYRERRRYQNRRLLPGLAIIVIVALAVWGIIGVLRSSTGVDDDTPAVSPPTSESAPASGPVEIRRGEPIKVTQSSAAPPTPPSPPTADLRRTG